MSITLTSSKVCGQKTQATYSMPQALPNLSADIFLSGAIPMFVMDAAASEQSTFVGKIYYSQQYNSMKLNGTLTGSSGKNSSFVSFLFDGSAGEENPAVMVSYVTLPGKSSPQCVLLPNTFDDDDSDLDWYDEEKNPYYLGSREYTSIYFQKGTTLDVSSWSHSYSSDPYTTLMQTTSGFPVFVGGNLLAPFISEYEFPTFISELDWTDASTAAIPQSTFALPAYWGCQQ